MATQEERLTTLERSFATFQKETVATVVEGKENYVILLGVVRSQGQDIKRILAHLDTVDQRLGVVEQRLSVVEQRLGSIETTLREQTSMLTQILERLPK